MMNNPMVQELMGKNPIPIPVTGPHLLSHLE
jgi:hypothetical protein